MGTVFLSPGVFTREQDFTLFASRAGVTRLGLVGKTMKGPAFEPTKITSQEQFQQRFGSTNPKLPLPYVANSFLSQSNELTVTRLLGKEGFENSPAWILVAGANSPKSGATLAVLRSKRDQVTQNFEVTQENEVTIGGVTPSTTPLSSFSLSATTGPLTAYTNSGFTVSLDETKEDYIVKLLGKSPKVAVGDPEIYVESIYPHFIREAYSRGEIIDLESYLVYGNTAPYIDYEDSYKDAVTPWVVSRVIGNDVKNLFKFRTISDGDSANREIKVSIQNIDVLNNTFDVLVRRFSDTDKTASQTALESFSNLSLDETSTNYIARAIGTTDEDYPRQSNYITVEMSEAFPSNTVPAGFRGYDVRDTGISGSTKPDLYYKSSYFSGDSIFRTYLGLSELGYTSQTKNQISFRNAIKSLEADFFSYQGGVTSGKTATKGFHMENVAPSGEFESGIHDSLTGYTNASGTFIDRSKLKFTLVPAGGFDGWDKYATYQNVYEEFAPSQLSNVEAFREGIDTFANPEEIDINLFATPGVDYSNNFEVINHALETIEDRADSLYIIDSPRVTTGPVKGTPQQVVQSLESSGIDTNYAATYWPWIQINDAANNVFTYQAPTLMAIQSIALTDNVRNPWWAPAGINRGTASSNVRRVDVKNNKRDRDTLYQGRVNPIAQFVQEGIVIMGQKTLQRENTALDRVNVRRLLLQLRRVIAAASRTLLFEQNDQALRDQFLSKVEPILLRIQNQRGLEDFRIELDDAPSDSATPVDRNTLTGTIKIKPTPAVEYIDLTFSVLPQGANFEDF